MVGGLPASLGVDCKKVCACGAVLVSGEQRTPVTWQTVDGVEGASTWEGSCPFPSANSRADGIEPRVF